MEPSFQDRPRALSKLGFWFAVAGLILIIGGFVVFESPFFQLRNIQFQGNNGLAREELIERMQLNRKISLFQLDITAMKSALLLVPSIRNVQFQRRLPNTLIVTVLQRTPFCIVARSEGLWVLSDDGVILERTEVGKNPRLPIVVGLQNLPIDRTKPERLSDNLFRQSVVLLKLAGEELQDELVEIDMKRHLVYTWDGIRVELGDERRIGEKMASLRALLAGTERQKIGEIDLRAPAHPIITARK